MTSTSTALALVCIIGTAVAGTSGSPSRPQLSINVKDGDFSGIGGLEPALTWEGSSRYGEMDLEYGIDVAAQSTSDIMTIPRRIWGRARQRIMDWDVSASAELDNQSGDRARVTIDADNEDLDLSLCLEGNAGLSGNDFSINRVQATKGLENDGGNRITINPRYDLLSREADVVLAWKTGDIDIAITLASESQKVKLSKKIDEDNWVSPTIDNKGDVSLEWQHRIDDNSSFTARVKPQEAIDVQWKDKEWTASVNMPVDGRDVSGANVHIKREVKF